MAHIPLIVHIPGDRHAGERRTQLTQNIDIMPTLLDYYNIPIRHPIHGASWKDILEGDGPARHEAVLYGWYGQTVNLTDGTHTYFRAPASEETPGGLPQCSTWID